MPSVTHYTSDKAETEGNLSHSNISINTDIKQNVPLIFNKMFQEIIYSKLGQPS